MATKTISELATPCFLLNKERLERNAQQMKEICRNLGTTLRPHTKTHKTIEIATLSTVRSKRGIAVSTLVEAETYADAGFEDILLAHPITTDKIDRCLKLMSRMKEFHVMVSDLSGIACLKNNARRLPDGRVWSVAIEIDNGYGRTGFLCNSEDFKTAFSEVMDSMSLLSLYTHCGGSYSIFTEEERNKHHKETVDVMNNAKHRILIKYPSAKFAIGIGSSPSCNNPSDDHKRVDEFHPGNYLFNDYEQYLLNACRQCDIACRVMTRVIAHKPEKHMILVDCGFLALGHDGMATRPLDFCLIEGESNLRMIGMTQEIGKIMAKEGELDCKKYPVGTVLFIYPFHSCLTAALHQLYYVHSGDEVVSTMKPVKGW